MTITTIKPGIVKLTAENGIYSIREQRIYSEVVCKEKDSKWYEDAVPESETNEEESEHTIFDSNGEGEGEVDE